MVQKKGKSKRRGQEWERERENKTKKVEAPKQRKNKMNGIRWGKECVEELKKVIQEMGLQQQMVQGLGDCIEKKIGVEMGKLKNEIKEEM